MPEAFVPFPKAAIEQSIPQRFAQQVRLHADEPAIRCGAKAVTYRDLDRLTDRVARAIVAARGPASEPVGLVFRQGIGSIVATLGALRAGKVFVPIDPSHEPAENGRILADSGLSLLVTHAKELDAANAMAPAGTQIVNIDDLPPDLPEAAAAVSLSADTPACLYYTSGSTGRPKGVVDCHRNLLHNVLRYTNALRIGPGDRLSMLQSPAFSGAASSLFTSLLNGASVHPIDFAREGVAHLARRITAESITIYHSVPAIFRALVDGGRQFPSVRVVRLEGDRASPRDVVLFRRSFGPDCMLVNGLGTTETGIARQYFVGPDTPVPDDVLPVGYPTEDVEVLLTDDAGAPVEPGIVGEICVRSRYLAPGYRNDPERTRERFRPDPNDPAARIYRTGDLGRMRSDGCLEHLGRVDQASRVNGRHVDTAAIESALTRLDEVREAVVTGRTREDGGLRIIAWVVPQPGKTPTASMLRRDLERRSPGVGLPHRFVVLDALPLDRNGKVDRTSLPDPDRSRPPLDAAFAAPRDATESGIAACWRDVLGLDAIGIDDDFFELGGDSLMALQLAVRLEEQLGRPVPPDVALAHPTIADMAGSLKCPHADENLVPMRETGAGPPLFCFHSKPGHVVEYRTLADMLGPDQPVYGLAHDPELASERRPWTVEAVAARHVEAIRRARPDGPYALCGNCFGGVLAFEAAQQLRDQGEEVVLLVLIDTDVPEGPLGRLWSRITWADRRRRVWELAPADLLGFLVDGAASVPAWLATVLRQRVAERTRRDHRTAMPHDRIDDAARYLLARVRYRPRTYAGSAMLICAGSLGQSSGWRRVIPMLETIVLPDTDVGPVRPHLFQEPFVADVAREIGVRMVRTAPGGDFATAAPAPREIAEPSPVL